MMEEISDDTNGESTFEFVGGKMDEIHQKDDAVSSTTRAAGFDPPIPTSMPENISSSHLFTSLPPSVEPFIPAIPSQGAPSMHVAAGGGTQETVAPIPMYNPAQPLGIATPPFIPSRSPVSPTQVFYQPISSVQAPPPSQNPYAQASQFMQSSPPVPPPPVSQQQQAYVQPMVVPQQQKAYVQPMVVPQQQQAYAPPMVPQAAFDLPVDDTYVSSSDQPYQGNGNEKGVWGWIKGNEFLNKVAEKAKNSVDSVITTLDPGMKEIIYSGGDINLVVASGNEPKVSTIREAFQMVFGKATVEGIAVQSMSIAPQPVGYSAGSKAAEERISNLRQQGLIHEHQAVVAIENFLAELIPEKWFDLGCITLQDPFARINLQVYTEAIPIDSQYVNQAKERTPPDYPLGWSGFAVTIGEIIGPALGVHHSEWHQALTGVSRREILLLAAKTLAGLYKAQLRR